MHLLNCIFLVITITTVVYANCYLVYNCLKCDFENLSNITEHVIPDDHCLELEFVNCHFGRFHKDFLNPAVQVRQLLMINSVEFIEDAAFDGYKEAHEICFRKNNVSLLPDFAFRGLFNLVYVDFSENRIVKIGENVFSDASSITHLNLADNRIESFCIKQLIYLQILNLENNLITVLSEIPKTLREAKFNFNRLTKIANVTFRNMKSLWSLHLGWNNITEIESRAFYGAKHLKYVDLSCNNLTRVSNIMDSIDDKDLLYNRKFWNIVSFQLILQQNKITSFSTKFLNIYDTSVSISVDLSQNSIEQLVKSKFNVTTNTDFLDLSRNKIKTVPIAFFHSQYHANIIRLLNLSTNVITELEVGSFLGLTSLKHLDLSHNRIETLKETIFLDTPNLLTLNVAHNPIRHLNAPEIVGFTSLQLIALCGNKFSNLTYVIEEFTKNNVQIVPSLDYDYESENEINCDNSQDLTFEVTTERAIEFSKEIAVKDGISTAGIVIISILCVAGTIFILMYAIYYKTVRRPIGIPEDLQEFSNIN